MNLSEPDEIRAAFSVNKSGSYRDEPIGGVSALRIPENANRERGYSSSSAALVDGSSSSNGSDADDASSGANSMAAIDPRKKEEDDIHSSLEFKQEQELEDQHSILMAYDDNSESIKTLDT